MDERERERSQPTRTAIESNAGDDESGDTRANVERMLGVADDIIARALSIDSERYLRSSRQSSGE